MAKQRETLLDEVYLQTFKEPRVFKPELRRQLQAARRFVLDDAMSAMLADIGWAAYKDDEAKGIGLNKRMDNIRHLARLPHAATWIEWSERPLATRAREVYGSSMDKDLVPLKTGWLLMQHPQIETAFQAVGFGYGRTNIGGDGTLDIGLMPFVITWKADDDPMPWRPHPATVDAAGKPLLFNGRGLASILTGLDNYESQQIGMREANEFMSPGVVKTAAKFRQLLNEQGGMMRYLLGLLATINDLPVGITNISISKGFVAKGNYRKFLDHSIITLTVPQSAYRALAQKAVTAMHRRAHQVRGHWRNDWRKPGNKTWIREHQRGDASLGFVTHSYVVEKGD